MTTIQDLAHGAVSTLTQDGPESLARAGISVARNELQRTSSLRPIDDLCYGYSIRRIGALQKAENELDDILDTAYHFSGIGDYRTIAPLQLRSELKAAVEFVADREPQTVMEIGTKYGGTFYAWCRGIGSVDTVLSLDQPNGSTPPGFLGRITP